MTHRRLTPSLRGRLELIGQALAMHDRNRRVIIKRQSEILPTRVRDTAVIDRIQYSGRADPPVP